MAYLVSLIIIDTGGWLLGGLLIDWVRGRYSDPEGYTKKYLVRLAKRHPEWKNK